ncbi:MAG: nucleotidyltransferase [Deltaproteobacteria bacterium]|nr:nucleotidyltransferase [Deltaproteobacteria bacterium]
MSVNSYLSQVSSRLILSDSEKKSITASIHTLKNRLSLYFGPKLTNHIQFGSSTRGTILPPKVDSHFNIDYMIVFNTMEGKQEPRMYYDELRRFADNNYSASEIQQSSPTVVLSLNSINFKLVPAIKNSGLLKIPSSKSYWTGWISTTDPDTSKNEILDKNKLNHNNIKPLVRLVKYWNAINNHPYISFSLEKHILDRYFLLCTSLKDYFYSFWDDISYNFSSAQDIIDLIDNAKKHIKRAREYEKDNMPASAEKEIKKLVPEF